jgi:hypothetical protein
MIYAIAIAAFLFDVVGGWEARGKHEDRLAELRGLEHDEASWEML